MAEAVLVTALVLFVQLADSWLRYLPFEDRIDDALKRSLRRRLPAWAIAVAPIYFAIFFKLGVTALTYKAVLMSGWLPFVLIAALTVKGKSLQHLFVVGMAALWILMQNNWASMIDVLFFLDEPESTILILHSIDYLLLFAATLPIERRCFTTLLPDDAFFDSRPQSYYIALMPLVIGLGHFMLWADGRLVHSWAERFSRLYLPVMFFFIYRYVPMGARTFFEHRRTMRESQMMDEQLRSLERHNRAMLDNRRQLEELRDNLRADYELLSEQLKAGDIDGARRHIEEQEAMLDATKVIRFCRAPLINAVMSIYVHQAERHKIACRHKINLATDFSTDENDFAILLSNVLENAINAGRKQPKGARELSIIIQHRGRQYVLEIANRFDGELQLGSDGLPTTTRKGHGIGMTSVQAFAAKYKAQAMFEQSDGLVKFSMYWRDGG